MIAQLELMNFLSCGYAYKSLCDYNCLWVMWCIAEVVMEDILNLHGSLTKAFYNFFSGKK